ncbi:hypothetical protein BDK51DRAFT_34788, partial [Blyttiomyces helicus]
MKITAILIIPLIAVTALASPFIQDTKAPTHNAMETSPKPDKGPTMKALVKPSTPTGIKDRVPVPPAPPLAKSTHTVTQPSNLPGTAKTKTHPVLPPLHSSSTVVHVSKDNEKSNSTVPTARPSHSTVPTSLSSNVHQSPKLDGG